MLGGRREKEHVREQASGVETASAGPDADREFATGSRARRRGLLVDRIDACGANYVVANYEGEVILLADCRETRGSRGDGDRTENEERATVRLTPTVPWYWCTQPTSAIFRKNQR